MCRYCESVINENERDTYAEPMMSETLISDEMTVIKDTITTEVFINSSEIGLCIESAAGFEYNDPLISLKRIKINFCPMCGRKLREEEK